MSESKPRHGLTRFQRIVVGMVLTLVVSIPLVYWRYQVGRERSRAQAAERIAQRAAEAVEIEVNRARLARQAERAQARERIRQLHDEIDALTQRDQKLIEGSHKPLARLDDTLERTSGERP